MKVQDWDRTIDVNIKGALYGIAAALPHMKAQKSGHIINVSSVAGNKVGPALANMVAFAISQPEDVEINEILFRPTKQEY